MVSLEIKQNILTLLSWRFFSILNKPLNCLQNEKTNKNHPLNGEGAHQHTLYGKFNITSADTDFTEIDVLEAKLIHELPNGTFGEHNTLNVESGEWVMGKQVEYDPMNRVTTRIWD